MHSFKPFNSILIKPAGPDCNMRCDYCFYLEKTKLFPNTRTHRMNEKILKRIIQQVMSHSEPEVSFAWQGGEPTLMGLDFFKKAVEFQQRFGKNQTIGNGLQTNGILIDREWTRFLSKYKFLVGLSLDGPKHIHDKYRRMKGGKDSWKIVTDKARLLLDSGIAVNALTVINDYSVLYPEEIYSFHKSRGLNYMQFIPCVEPDPLNPGKTSSLSTDPVNFGKFLVKLFDLWTNDFNANGPTTSIRFFESVFYNYGGLPAPDCTLRENCGIYIVVEHNGDVYSCDFFVDNNWKLGNIMKTDNSGGLRNMLNSPLQDIFGKRKSSVPHSCLECQWYDYCRGGCPKDRLIGHEDQKVNYLCPAYKIFFRHAHVRLKKMAVNWRQSSNYKS